MKLKAVSEPYPEDMGNECLVKMLSFYDYLLTNLDSEAMSRHCQNDIFYGCDAIMTLTDNIFGKSSGLFNKFEMDINKDPKSLLESRPARSIIEQTNLSLMRSELKVTEIGYLEELLTICKS